MAYIPAVRELIAGIVYMPTGTRIMGRPGPQTQAKRQREQAKREKRRAKEEKKALRKADKVAGKDLSEL